MKEREKMSEDTCKKCGVEMWREGRIDDDIKLCHSCYLEIAEKGGNPGKEEANV
jgi:ribosomal protein L37AE/L43A